MSEKLVLIDGHSILNRAFYGVPDLSNAEGLHTNAVYGFLNIMFKLLDEEKPDYMAVAFDLSAPTFRHKMYDGYKGTRKPMLPELRQQVPLIKEMLHAMQIHTMEMEGYEADDLIGTMSVQAEKAGLDVSIISGDRDLLQLATEKVKLLIPKTKKTGTEIEVYYSKDVEEKYLVSPKAFIDVKALMGDTSDNIPGVAGIGEKGATKLIAQYGDIDRVFAHLEEIKPNRSREALRGNEEIARFSKELATICLDAPVTFDKEATAITDFYTEEAYLMMKRLEFKNFLGRFSEDSKKDPLEGAVTEASSYEEALRLVQETDAEAISVVLLSEKGHDILSWAADKAACVYFYEEKTQAQELIEALLKQAKRSVSDDLKKLLHFLEAEDAYPYHTEDASILAYLLNPLKNGYTYDEMASEYASQMLPAKEDLIPKKTKDLTQEELHQRYVSYAAASSLGILLALDPMLESLKDKGMVSLYEDIEHPLIQVLASMEKEGIAADREALFDYGQNLISEISRLEQEIYDEAGETFNILSPKQLGVILFEKMQLPNGKKTKTGYSTAADVLEKLAPEYPIVNKILSYRQLTKLKSTYADSLQDQIAQDGRIHTTFNQAVTATGRLSSSDPNLQNIPVRMELGRQIRKVFAAKEGYVFIDADYSQIELRILAHMSGDENLIRAYNEAQDIHRLTASQVFHVPFDEVSDLQRRNAKAVNFGIIYGISSFGLSQDLSITRKEAESYMEQYFASFPKIKAFLNQLVEGARETGSCRTLFGRLRPMPELSSSNFMQRSFGERVAMNAPIQGTAADIIKIAMIKVYEKLKKEKLQSRLLLQVHDELLIEAPQEEAEQVYQILQEEMNHAADLAVTLEVDIHEGKNWYEAK